MALGRKTGGRTAGTPNKASLEKQRVAAEIAARTVADARINGKKLAKDILEEFMCVFAGMAATCQPLPPGVTIVPPGREPNAEAFVVYARLAVDTAAKLAEFQSPKFKAVMQMAPPAEPPPKQVEGNVVPITTDAESSMRVWRRMIATYR